MSDFPLGQRVEYSERLVRVSVHITGPRSEDLLQSAMDLMGIPRKRGVSTHRGLHWKLWVPQSFATEHVHRGLSMLQYSTAPASGHGFIAQRATLQQGGTSFEGYDEPPVWLDHGTTRAYKVAFDINRKPIHVLSEHLTAVAS